MSRLPFSKTLGCKLHNVGSAIEAVSVKLAGKRPKAALFHSDHRSVLCELLSIQSDEGSKIKVLE